MDNDQASILLDLYRLIEGTAMATHAFVAYRLTVAPPGRPNDLVDLTDIDGCHTDLASLAYGFLADVKAASFMDEDRKQYLAVTNIDPKGRTVRFEGQYGPYGQSGNNIIDIETNKSVHELGDKDAFTTRVRNMIVVPVRSKTGFFLAERYGGRGLASTFLREFGRAFRVWYKNYRLHAEGLTNGQAWQEFLKAADLAQVRVIKHHVASDLADSSTGKYLYNLSHAAKPARGQKYFPRFVRDGLIGGTIKPQTILGLDPDTEVDETRLEMHGLEWQKDFVLNPDEMPVLVYPLASDDEPRPGAGQVYQRMEEVVMALCPNLGVDLTPDWKQGDWPAEALAVTLEAIRGDKWSVSVLIKDQLDTLVNERTHKPWIPDYIAFFVLPLALGAIAFVTKFRFAEVDGILAGIAILTGLLFALVIHVFSLGLRITDDPRIGAESRTSRLIDQLQSNVLYTVLVGIVTTVALSIASATTESGHRTGKIMTAILVVFLIHMILMIMMILKRMRSTYQEFRH